MRSEASVGEFGTQPARAIPEYLRRHYWWAYVHPTAVRVFERQWLVNTILCGNLARLRDAVLDEFGAHQHAGAVSRRRKGAGIRELSDRAPHLDRRRYTQADTTRVTAEKGR